MRAVPVFNRALMPGSTSGPGALYFPHGFAPLYDVSQRTHLGIAVKATFRLSTGEPLSRASQEEVELVDTLDTEGLLRTPADIALLRTGTSIAVRGRGSPIPAEPLVSIEVGSLSGQYRFFANRMWGRQVDGEWTIRARTEETRPAARDLAWTSAYGGRDGEDVYQANPMGVGFVSARDRAEGTALPWLEEVSSEIKQPQARPKATLPSLLPVHWEDRRAFFPFDESQRANALSWPEDLDPRFFDVVPQRWVHRPFLRGGEAIRISGLVTSAALSEDRRSCSVVLPRRAFRLVCGHQTLPMHLTIVRIEPEDDRIVLTFATTVPYPIASPRALPVNIVEKRITERGEA